MSKFWEVYYSDKYGSEFIFLSPKETGTIYISQAGLYPQNILPISFRPDMKALVRFKKLNTAFSAPVDLFFKKHHRLRLL